MGSVGIAILALLGLLGYLPGLRIISSLRSDYVPMAISTAGCFLFLAAALFLHTRKPWRGFGLMLAEAPVIFVTAFSLLNVAGSFAGLDLNFENRLFPAVGTLGKIPIGHMSPASGAAFIMAGLATFLLLLASGSSRLARRLAPWAASLGILTVLAGATVVLSYLYGVPLMYSGSAVPMAATTAMAFLFLGTALVAAAGPESYPTLWVLGDSTAARLSRVFLPLTMATVLLQGILSRFVTATSRINHALFLAALVIAAGAITAALVVRVAHAIGNRLDEVNRKLRQSEARAQALLRTVPDMLFRIDRQGVFLDYKADSKDLYAQTEPTLIGKRLRDIVPPAFADLIDLKTRAVLETGKLQTFEYRLPIPGSGERDYEARMAASGEDEVTAIVRDITERKRAAEALRQSEAQQSNALQMTKSGHWEYDVDRDLFTFNDNFYRIFRTTAAAAGGYQLSSGDYARRFCHPDDMAMVGSETRGAIESPDPNYSRQIEHRILYADGEVGYIAVRFFIVKDAQGRTVKTYGVNQDITERKRAEEEIKRQLTEKEILLKEVHHRIKNNIASISGLISLRLQSISDPAAVVVLQEAIGRVDSMRLLYDKILLGEDYKEISVKNYIENLADAIVALFPGSANVTVEKHIADFHLDSKQLFPLGLIINELLTNKMKYAFINRKTGLIKISLKSADSHITLIMQDDGVGLPDGFDIDKSKGFGLMLVKMLSQQLGGSFTIETRNGTRSKVEFKV